MPLTTMAKNCGRRMAGVVLVAVTLGLPATVTAKVVGNAVFARGVATSQKADGRLSILGKDTPIEEGDVLSTGRESFAIVRFNDGTAMTLRPNTVFKVEAFEHDGGRESALMRLFKGGLRAVTGLVSKRNPDGVQIRTAVATIGIRGTDFSARLCADDCLQEAKAHESFRGKRRSGVVGRVAFVKGDLHAITNAGERRRVVAGGPVHQGDILETAVNSIAVLAFVDQARLTLQSDSRFVIEQYTYEEQAPERNSALLRLVRGGLRAVTGLLAQARPDGYQMRTPVATIGIRGTGFDLVCQGTCVEGATTTLFDPMRRLNSGLTLLRRALIPDAFAQAVPGANGLFILPWQGAVLVDHAQGQIRLDAGQNLFLASRIAPPLRDPTIPANVRQRLAEAIRPDQAEVPPKVFETQPLNEAKPGLYVSVYDDGHATLKTQDGETVDIGQDEAAFLGTDPGAEPTRIEGGLPTPLFRDPYNVPPQDDLSGPGLGPSPGGGACAITG